MKLLGGPMSGFCRDFSMKRVSKAIELMTAVNKLHDPQCEFLLLRNCAGVGSYFMH